MTVGEIMTTDVITVTMDNTLDQVKKLFAANNCHHVLVLDDTSLVGLISDRDVLASISPQVDSAAADARAMNTLQKRAHQIMTRTIVSVTQDMSVEEATQILLKEGISCLPVLSSSKDIDGILTWRDMLKYFLDKA
jgi:acetoin utilization protein AcuB